MAFAAGAAAVGMGASAIGGFMDKSKEYKAQRHRWENSLNIFRRARGEQNAYLGKAQNQLEGIAPYLNKQYSLARADLGRAGTDARQQVTTGANRAMGSTMQSLASRGLGNTTVLDNARNSIGVSASRSLASIDESLGSMFAGLRTQQAGAVAGAKGGLANFYGQRGQIGLDTQASFIDLYMNGAPQRPSPWAAIGSGINAMSGMLGSGGAFGAGGYFGKKAKE